MAERSNATAKKTQDAPLDVSTLQKRGRRRLVGAIALVLLAVIVLPMVFDPEPKPAAPLVNIRIPSEEGSKFTPKVVPKAGSIAEDTQNKAGETPAAPAAAPDPAPAPSPVTGPVKAAAQPVAKAPEPATPVEKPAAKVAEKPAAKVAEKPAALAPTGEQWVFQVGAFASLEKVKEIVDQLNAAKLPHYTESVAIKTGSVTRVRLGPFASKEAADRALERAKALGLNPVRIASK